MKFVVTGGTGFIGRHLVSQWLKAGHQVSILTRDPTQIEQRWPNDSNVVGVRSLDSLSGRFDVLVNLSGEGIADKPWSDTRIEQLYASRIGITEQLADWAKRTEQHFSVVVSGSAIGFYGESDQVLTESSPKGSGFAATLCADWEQATSRLAPFTNRLCILRTGVVLGLGGALDKMWLPFRLGLGGRLGHGRQYFSWIHLDDCVGAIQFLIGHEDARGAYNLTAPNAVTNVEFSDALARSLHRRAWFPVPRWVLKIMLGKRAALLLESQHVVPEALLAQGFSFRFPDLAKALREIVARR